MQFGLRPKLLQFRRSEALLDVADRRLARAAVDVAEESRAAAPRLIDDVDRIAVGDEIIGPAAASIRRAQEIRRGLAAAVNHHHRVGAGPVLGDLILHEHLADHDRLLVDLDIAAGNREYALVGDLERPARIEQTIVGHGRYGQANQQRRGERRRAIDRRHAGARSRFAGTGAVGLHSHCLSPPDERHQVRHHRHEQHVGVERQAWRCRPPPGRRRRRSCAARPPCGRPPACTPWPCTMRSVSGVAALPMSIWLQQMS